MDEEVEKYKKKRRKKKRIKKGAKENQLYTFLILKNDHIWLEKLY